MKPLSAAFRAACRRVLISHASDATELASGRSALVVAPHPDDETLGCGARILHARRAGTRVTVVVATTGAGSHYGVDPADVVAQRRTELAAAADRLGLDRVDVVELGYEDGQLQAHLEDLARQLERIIRDRQPDDVYTTCSQEWHPDHAAAALATRIAVDRSGLNPRVAEYPIWLWADWPVSVRQGCGRGLIEFLTALATRSVEVVRVDPVRTDKTKAIQAYASQLGQLIPSRSNGSATSATLPLEVINRALDGPELFFVQRVDAAPSRRSART